MDLDKAIQSRRSVKKFKDKKPDWREVIEAIDSARYAPMAGNIFSLKFVVVFDEKTILKLADASQQPFISEAKCAVIVCSNPSLTVNAYGERGDVYLRQQAGAAMQNFWLALLSRNLSTCWVGAFVDEMVKKALKIPDKINVEAIFPIGYESEKKFTRKAKIDMDRILYFEEYGNKKMKEKEHLDV